MNPLTQVKNLQKITDRETAAGVSDEGSWHAKYKDSAYIFAGGLPFDLTEGDLLAVFAQYGEIVDLNLVRDKGTGKSKGFAFIAYEDQRSTVLAVDNLNGGKLLGRIIRVDHVLDYKRKLEEDEEEEQRKREERGVCYAFQRGECTRGSGCKFSHDEQRNANTGWGPKPEGPKRRPDRGPGAEGLKWAHDRYEDSKPPDRSDSARLKDSDRKSRFDEGRTKGVEDRRSRFEVSSAGDDRRSRYDERRGRGFEDGSRLGDDKRGRGFQDGSRLGDDKRGRGFDDGSRLGDDKRGRGFEDGSRLADDKRGRGFEDGFRSGDDKRGRGFEDGFRSGDDKRGRGFEDGSRMGDDKRSRGPDGWRSKFDDGRSRFDDGRSRLEEEGKVGDDRRSKGLDNGRSRLYDDVQDSEGRRSRGFDNGKSRSEDIRGRGARAGFNDAGILGERPKYESERLKRVDGDRLPPGGERRKIDSEKRPRLDERVHVSRARTDDPDLQLGPDRKHRLDSSVEEERSRSEGDKGRVEERRSKFHDEERPRSEVDKGRVQERKSKFHDEERPRLEGDKGRVHERKSKFHDAVDIGRLHPDDDRLKSGSERRDISKEVPRELPSLDR